MTETIEFELVFALPEGNHDPYELSDIVFEAGFEASLVGTGVGGLLSVTIFAEGERAENLILDSARAILSHLPKGSGLREVRPDLVSIADVAKRLNISRQALQKRKMPPSSLGDLYRSDEVLSAISASGDPAAPKRKPRFNIEDAMPWFRGGTAAHRINAGLSLGLIDPSCPDPMAIEKINAIRQR